MKRIRIAPNVEKIRPAGWYRSFLGRKSREVTPPPMSDPIIPSTIVHIRLRCSCITDFPISPASSPMIKYQSR
jgi:hypothetical protein